jgi:hypothetical protein
MKNEERKMKNRSTHITIYKKMKRIYHSSFLSFHLNYSSFFIHHLKSVFILSFFVFHLMGCKDKEPITPKVKPFKKEDVSVFKSQEIRMPRFFNYYLRM